MIYQLLHQRNIIASEASLVSNLSEYFAKKFPSIIDNFKSIGNGITETIFSKEGTDHFNLAEVTSKQKTFLKALQHENFMNTTEVTVFVPEGLCVPYRLYLDNLLGMVSFCETISNELTEFNVFISRLISDDNYQLSTDYVKNKLFTITKDIDDLIDASSECFKKGSTSTETKLKNVIKNNSEWTSVFNQLNDLTKRVEGIDHAGLKKKIKESSDLLDLFIPKIKRGEFKNISPQMVEKLGDYTYLIAKSLEIYSVTHYRIIGMETAIEKSLDKMNAIMNK